jgi:hypothetical protein
MTNKKTEKFFSRKISKKQTTDAGMAFVLILLLLGLFSHNIIYYKISIPVLIVNMTVPKLFYPMAILWYAFADLLGLITSKIILTIIFVAMILPTSIIRRILGKDSLQLYKFKKSNKSVLINSKIKFEPANIEKPF